MASWPGRTLLDGDPRRPVQQSTGRKPPSGTPRGSSLDFGIVVRYLRGVASIETRRDLAQFLQAQMASGHGFFPGEDEEELETTGRTSLKTYLVESHVADDQEAVLHGLERVGSPLGFSISATKDRHLFRLHRHDADLWCDTSFGRFWRLHTTAPVKVADPIRDGLVAGATWLDNVWLSPRYLESLSTRSETRLLTFSLRHDRRPLSPEGMPSSEADFVSLRLWSSQAREQLSQLRAVEIFPHGVSVGSVRLRSGGDDPESDFCVAEYFHDGKVTASGTSFDEHNRLLVHALRDYDGLVQQIEDRRIRATNEGQREVRGQPLTIDVQWRVSDLRFAVRKMFSSAGPFRLWGLPTRLAEDHYRARAVDLHFGGVIDFDITRDWITIQLGPEVCGNTVVRFLSNLRFHVSSDAGIQGLEGSEAGAGEASRAP